MPKDTKEPQSYGSGSDWVSGKTGQQVNDPKSEPTAEHREFYDESRESETNTEHQGGDTSDFQRAENAAQPAGNAAHGEPSLPRVTTNDGGAKRDSYFKKRDYD